MEFFKIILKIKKIYFSLSYLFPFDYTEEKTFTLRPFAGCLLIALTLATEANIDWHNRQLHPSEAQRIQRLAKQMAEEDQDGLHLNQEQWAQRLRIAAASRIDAKDNQTINTQLARTVWSNPLPITEDYLDSLNLAATVLQQEAAQNTPIHWQDGSAIIADGAAVHAFQASDAQYRDHKLFSARDIPARMPPYIAEYTLSGSPTNMLPQIARYGGQEQEHHQELLKIAGEHWKNRRHYDYEKILNHDYYAYTGTGEVRPSYPVLSLLGTGIGKASAWAGKKVLDKGLSRVAAKEARQVGGKGLFQLGRGEGVKGVAKSIGDLNSKGPTIKQFEKFQKQLEIYGIHSLERSQRKIKWRLNEYLEKLSEIKKTGGYTSLVNREIRNFVKELEAIQKTLKNGS